MTTRQQRRQNRSNKNQSSDPKPKNWLLLGGIAVVVVAVAVVAVSAISTSSSDPVTEADSTELIAGGSIIGDPNAPVTLVEFGDFQ